MHADADDDISAELDDDMLIEALIEFNGEALGSIKEGDCIMELEKDVVKDGIEVPDKIIEADNVGDADTVAESSREFEATGE